MGCSSCGTGGSGGGCGTSGSDGKSGGCGKSGTCSTKLNSFDWLSDMSIGLAEAFDVVEIRFKNGRKEFYRNTSKFELYSGDPVVVEMTSGYHLGHVALQGEIVRLQMKRKLVKNNDEIKAIVRKAGTKDLEKYELSRNRETGTMYRARNIIIEQKLQMKLTDVEYQADNTKATFYYSADERVDFRELIKFLASEFKIRVEMKQISLRHEAARLGGIGSCGRELCCSTWISDFKNVNTSAARYQNLSLNPSKLSGQCGRLKCCLNYELDTYLDALKGIPEVERPLLTEKGSANLLKTDIFKKMMWFAYADDGANWIPVSVDRVYEIIALNKENKKPATLEHDEEVLVSNTFLLKEKSELSRFDEKFQVASANKKKKKKKKPSNSTDDRRSTDSATPTRRTDATPNPRPEQNRPRPQQQPARSRQNIVNKPESQGNAQAENESAKPVSVTPAAPKPSTPNVAKDVSSEGTTDTPNANAGNKPRNNKNKRKPNRPPHRPSENKTPPTENNEN